MKNPFQNLMTHAAGLTRAGDLRAATAAIQAALAGGAEAARQSQPSDVIEVEAREVRAHQPDTQGPTAQGFDVPLPAGPVDADAEAPLGERFIAGTFTEGGLHGDYKLYIPPNAGARPLPLVVMLHGCTQHPDDFAAGTAMNEAARTEGFYVLYPAQSRRANPQGCWNWFKHSHQQRGRGEPALLAGMTRHVMQQQAIDPRRVYVAGLSAGGAMAAILGSAYPELYAAVGVHSGLAAGAASDLSGALAAMKGGAASAAAHDRPTIVFHGDADSTVHPANAEQVVAACAGATSQVETQQVHTGQGRAYTRRVHKDPASGRVLAEHWLVHGAPHAWSGGSSRGSYTDSRGPDASAEMVRFFLEHPHPALQ
jgi:poly(hydroxyalkanoate) depolymerase family esterase